MNPYETAGLDELSRLAGIKFVHKCAPWWRLTCECFTAVKCGANPLTLAGLSGVGDLILTCTGDLSRYVP